METPLVSILTPSYNCAHLIHRLLDSVSLQSYSAIEMIVIDDGSKDNTKEVVESYIPQFLDRGYSLRYLYQENSGQSVAIDSGLKLITGDYLIWPDADDFFRSSNAVESLVDTIASQTDEVGLVRCEAYYLDEDTLEIVGSAEDSRPTDQDGNIFEDCLYARPGFFFTAGCCIARVKDIDRYIPGREIYTEKSAGQNWQLMLPLFYNRRCVTIRQKLYNILVRRSSHSRSKRDDYNHMIAKYASYERTIQSSLLSMPHLPDDQKSSYMSSIRCKYLLNELMLNVKFRYRKNARVNISQLKELKCGIPIKLRVYYYFPALCESIIKFKNKLSR